MRTLFDTVFSMWKYLPFLVLTACGPAAATATVSLPPSPTPTAYVTVPVTPAPATVQTRAVRVQVPTTTTSTLPPLRQWEGPIPEQYGAGSGCTREEAGIVARAFWTRGATDDTVLWALGMISRESTCDSAAHNGNRRTGDDSWGLCQINALAGHFGSNGIVAWYDRFRFAVDFGYNADACAHLWSVCGRGPWNYGDYYCEQPTS